MDNIVVSEDGSITLDLSLRKRLGDPSAYHKNSSEARELFLFWVYKGRKEYLVIHTNIQFEYSPGYAYTANIQKGKITLPNGLHIKPGQILIWDGTIYPSVPVWLEVL